MTKRAGKRKFRMGAQPGKPTNGAPVQKPHTLVEDGLSPRTSLALEKQALLKGWIVPGDRAIQLRELLLQKLVKSAAESNDTKLVLDIVKVIALVEQRTEQLSIQRDRLNQPHGELPQQINIGVNVQQAPEAPKPYEIIQQLISRRDVRDAAAPEPVRNPRPETSGLRGFIDANRAGAMVDAGEVSNCEASAVN